MHVNLKVREEFHVNRAKPFFGTRQDALEIAKLDKNQFLIVGFNYFEGNPHARKTLKFNITFEDETVNRKFDADLAATAQFESYVESQKFLFPLRYATRQDARRAITALNKTAITICGPKDKIFLDLRFFDGTSAMWFDSLQLPEKGKVYVMEAVVESWDNKTKTAVKVKVKLLSVSFILKTYDVQSCVYLPREVDRSKHVVVDKELIRLHPAIKSCLNP